MLLKCATIFGLVLLVSGAAIADEILIPIIDVDSLCQQQNLKFGVRYASEQALRLCIRDSQEQYDLLKAQWPAASDDVKQKCLVVERRYAASPTLYRALNVCVPQLMNAERQQLELDGLKKHNSFQPWMG
jgi:hypothetical protein